MISAELYAFGAIIYLLLGSGEKQYWADGWPLKTIKNGSVERSSVTVKHSIQVETPCPEKARLQPHSIQYGAVQ